VFFQRYTFPLCVLPSGAVTILTRELPGTLRKQRSHLTNISDFAQPCTHRKNVILNDSSQHKFNFVNRRVSLMYHKFKTFYL
jgi:hypothetical protein